MADKYECRAFGDAQCPWTGNITGRCSIRSDEVDVVRGERCSSCKLTIDAVLASLDRKPEIVEKIPTESIPTESKVFKMCSEGYDCSHKGGSTYSLVLPERDLKMARMFQKFAGRNVRITIEEAGATEEVD